MWKKFGERAFSVTWQKDALPNLPMATKSSGCMSVAWPQCVHGTMTDTEQNGIDIRAQSSDDVRCL